MQNGSNGKRTAAIVSEDKVSNEANQCTTQKPKHSCASFREIGHLLSKPRFYACVLAVVAMDYTMAVFPATIVDYALDKGSSRRDADLSVTYCSPAELFGRIVLPLIGDCRIVSRTTLVSACFFLLAATMLALPATPSFLAYILVCACVTMFTACLIAMKPVVIADYFGIESVATSWGFAGVTLLPLLLCSPYIIGVGVGVVCVTLVIVVMMYFDKYRGIASGIKYTGYSLASLLFPMILTSLKDAYGFRGSMLVYAAITMNVTALTLLLKEPPWEINDRNRKTKTSKEESKSISSITNATLDSAVINAFSVSRRYWK
ncbi:hypothetical protein HPB49_013346 [Dermacentor silvarum]|uniref:Uncharacterized protein n=1 Tax=Dermacentor silvarum TaxID=543639 RepID=A0ACB8D5U8_DERSI|nr:hypothetical protein HPB49_013346 [Dermacentor silvarum]